MRTQENVASMLCPHCKTGLLMSDRSGVEIDFCPSCRGVWLDRGELDKIIERTQPPVVREVERGRDTENRNSPDRRGSPGGLMGMALCRRFVMGADGATHAVRDTHRTGGVTDERNHY